MYTWKYLEYGRSPLQKRQMREPGWGGESQVWSISRFSYLLLCCQQLLFQIIQFQICLWLGVFVISTPSVAILIHSHFYFAFPFHGSRFQIFTSKSKKQKFPGHHWTMQAFHLKLIQLITWISSPWWKMLFNCYSARSARSSFNSSHFISFHPTPQFCSSLSKLLQAMHPTHKTKNKQAIQLKLKLKKK